MTASTTTTDYAHHRTAIIQRLRQRMESEQLDALIAFSAENSYYLSGHGSFFSYTLPTPGSTAAILLREDRTRPVLIAAEIEAAGVDLDIVDTYTYPIWMSIDDPFGVSPFEPITTRSNSLPFESIIGRIQEVLTAAGSIARVGVEHGQLHSQAWSHLTDALSHPEIVDARPLLNESRAIKTGWEVNQLETAAAATEQAITNTVACIEPGMTRHQIRKRFDLEIIEHPATDGIRLDMISVGPQFAPSMFGPGGTVETSALVKFDVGAMVNGYGADMARTFSFGDPTPRAAERWQALSAGHEFLRSEIGPGVIMSDLFHATMATVERHGLTGYTRGHFGHSVGLGRTVEEPPHLGPGELRPFEPGMVICIETPYYAYGVGSLQLEDMVAIEEGGARNLCSLPRTLARLPLS